MESLISYQVFTKLIRHNRRLKSCYLGKKRLQKVFNKRGQIILTSNVYSIPLH